ncbi:uncharacterized protein ACN2A1_013044 isoform 1-T2 [Glossina fuscipes fuscipes]
MGITSFGREAAKIFDINEPLAKEAAPTQITNAELSKDNASEVEEDDDSEIIDAYSQMFGIFIQIIENHKRLLFVVWLLIILPSLKRMKTDAMRKIFMISMENTLLTK